MLLDTNVVSEIMRPRPSPAVLAWLAEQAPERTHLSSVTIAEIQFGLHLLGDTRRRSDLQARFDRFVDDGFAARVIDFDQTAAHRYGAIAAKRRTSGTPMTVPDAQIAAMALVNDLALATRNTRDFRDLDLALVDPFVG